MPTSNLSILPDSGGSGAGDASSANQVIQTQNLEQIKNKLPSSLSADRLKVDGSGVTQPISAIALPLPISAATDATLQSVRDKLPSALSSDRLKVDGSGVTQPISATALPLPTNAATDATIQSVRDRLPNTLGENLVAAALNVALATSGWFSTAFGRADDVAATGDAANSGLISLVKRTNSRITSLINTITGLLPAAPTAAALNNFTSNTVSTQLLAANAARLGGTFYNESTAILYLKFGAVASSTSYTVLLQPNDYYELPYRYTGRVDGVWSAANGFARVTELT